MAFKNLIYEAKRKRIQKTKIRTHRMMPASHWASSGAARRRRRRRRGTKTLDVGGWQVVVADGHAVLPEGMTHLPHCAFRRGASLVSVAFPRSLVSIGIFAFDGCSSLVSIDLPAGLISIGSSAFYGCSSLSSVTFPVGLTSIGHGAVARCSSSWDLAAPSSEASCPEYACSAASAAARSLDSSS